MHTRMIGGSARSLRAMSLVAFAGLAAAPQVALAQLPANINPQLRPLVTVQFSGGNVTNANRLGIGLFDTGNTNLWIPPQTNGVVGVAQSTGTAAGADPFNEGGNGRPIGRRITLTAGGFLGATLNGPETGGAQPQHLLTGNIAAGNTLARTDTAARGNIAPTLGYFQNFAGFNWSLINIGTEFLGSTGTGRLAYVVDPVNAGIMPFAMRNVNVANTQPSGAAGNWAPSALPIDQLTSNVSFYAPANLRMPTVQDNMNPNFLFSYRVFGQAGAALPGGGAEGQLDDVQAGPAGNPTAATQGAPGLMLALGAGNEFGIGAANYIMDTGAPNTGAAAGETLLGTQDLNRWGQYVDISQNVRNGGQATAIFMGPRHNGDREVLGPGMLFNVDRNAGGLSATGVSQFQQFGTPAVMNSGAAATPSDNTSGQHSVGVFRTNMSGTNAGYIAGTGGLGLLGNFADQMDGLSLGADAVGPTGAQLVQLPPEQGGGVVLVLKRAQVFFSVDALSAGANDGAAFGGGVVKQASLGQSAGDVFYTSTGRPARLAGENILRFNQDVMGLGANFGPLANNDGSRGNYDNLRDLDLRPDLGIRAGTRIMRNIDPAITAANNGASPANIDASIGNRNDILGGTFDAYFSLDVASASVGALGGDAATIFANIGAGNSATWAASFQMGLNPGDDLDALALSRPTALPAAAPPVPGFNAPVAGSIGTYVPNFLEEFPSITFDSLVDLAVFSLGRGSVHLGLFDPNLGRVLSAADLFITDFDGTFTLWASAESLGLNPTLDNIDGLDVMAIPAPGAASLLAAAGLLASRRRRRA